MRSDVALGFRVHSGWAALVALAGPPSRPSVLHRARIQLWDPAHTGPFQPYHIAADMNLPDAEQFITRAAEDASSHARCSLGEMLDRLRERTCAPAGSGILFGSGRRPGTLAEILASHAMIHSAEGDFFRQALVSASDHFGLPVIKVIERDLWLDAEKSTGLPTLDLQQHLAAMGKSIGPPWRQDEKYASLAAWIVLAGSTTCPQSVRS